MSPPSTAKIDRATDAGDILSLVSDLRSDPYGSELFDHYEAARQVCERAAELLADAERRIEELERQIEGGAS